MTGDQWLEIHRAEQAEADRYREVRDDYELTDDRADAVAAEPAPAVEPQRDIREAAVRDPGEDGDRRPRVPVVDETTATVARAGAALDELQARGAAEQAHAADEAAERDAAEQERRAELARWSAEETEIWSRRLRTQRSAMTSRWCASDAANRATAIPNGHGEQADHHILRRRIRLPAPTSGSTAQHQQRRWHDHVLVQKVAPRQRIPAQPTNEPPRS